MSILLAFGLYSESLPPGIVFLVPRLLKAFFLSASVYVVSVFVRNVFKILIPPWAVMAAAVTVMPLVLIVSINLETFKDKRAAHALGAVMIPQIPSKRFAGFDVIEAVNHARQNGCLGYLLGGWMETVGHTYSIRALFGSRIVTDEPEYTKMILSTRFDDFEKGSSFRGYMRTLLGDGIFNADGELWRFHRSMTRPFFTHEKISHFEIFDRHAEDVINQIKARLDEGIAVDIQDAFFRFTLDSSSEYLFGTDVCSLSAGISYPETSPLFAQHENHPSNVFSTSFKIAQNAVVKRASYGDNWPLFEFWADQVKKETKNLNSFFDPIIKTVLENKKVAEKFDVDDSNDITMLEHLVQFTDDHTVLRDETLNILIASRDTTAALLTFAIYALAENPHVLKRLRQEILTTVGPSEQPSTGHLRIMQYLRAVLNETMRLFPPVPLNTRTSKKAVVLPPVNGGKPMYLPANTRIHYSVFLMHRRRDLWGPDALEFDPDRFLDHRMQKYLVPNPSIFLPFNTGPRICVGQQFAYNEASFMLIRLLQAFKSISIDMDANPGVRPPPGWADGIGMQPIEKIWPGTHLTAYVRNGLWVKMVEA